MSNGLRIGHMIGSLSIGGAERQVVNLLNELPSGNAVLVMLSRPIGELAADLHPTVNVQQGRARKRSLPVDILRLAAQLKKLRLDVLQTHMFWANLVGSIAGTMAGVKVIVTTEHGRNEAKKGWERWSERRIISRLVDARVCVSDDIRMLRIRSDGVPASKLCVIPNGTPERPQAPFRSELPLTVGTIGRLVEAKDFSSLIAAAALLKDRGVPCRVVIVGDGPYREHLAGEVHRRRLQDVVDLAGPTSDPQSWLERFDIYAVSSIREGQPLSLLEAMANGLAIVATNVGGIPRTVEDGAEALLVQAGDPASMAREIARLVNDPLLRRRLSLAARQRQIRDFSVAASLQKHIELYERILERKAQ